MMITAKLGRSPWQTRQMLANNKPTSLQRQPCAGTWIRKIENKPLPVFLFSTIYLSWPFWRVPWDSDESKSWWYQPLVKKQTAGVPGHGRSGEPARNEEEGNLRAKEKIMHP